MRFVKQVVLALTINYAFVFSYSCKVPISWRKPCYSQGEDTNIQRLREEGKNSWLWTLSLLIPSLPGRSQQIASFAQGSSNWASITEPAQVWLTLWCTLPNELLHLIPCRFYACTRKKKKSALYKLFPILATHVSVPKSPHVYTKKISLHGLRKMKSNYFLMHNS